MGKPVGFSELSDSPQICIIGAGFSGLCAAIQLKRKLNFTGFTIYESNSKVGGCWLTNNYPGSGCSVPCTLYSLSFAPKASSGWSKHYADQSEILEYLEALTRKFDLFKNIKLGCEVKKLIWNEKLNKWNVHVLNKATNVESEICYDIIINGSGQFRIPQKPKEFLEFQGPIIHTAEWDDNVKLDGKTVAVIGSGATAVQLIPEIAKKVSKLLAYQRSAIWIVPSFQFRYSTFTKWWNGHLPGYHYLVRARDFSLIEILARGSTKCGPLKNRIVRSLIISYLELCYWLQLRNHPELREKLTPNHPFGCIVPGFANHYFSSFKLPHVKLISNKISEVRSNSIVTEDGTEEKIDVLILATGFRVHDFFAPMEIIGTNGENILSKWKKNGPSAYLGITNCDMPNYFILFGPGTAVPGSVLFQIECQVHFVIEILKEMMKRKAKVVIVKESAELEYMKEREKDLETTIFNTPECLKVSSWFTDSSRLVNTAVFPKGSRKYRRRTRTVDCSKFNFI